MAKHFLDISGFFSKDNLQLEKSVAMATKI